MKKTDMIYEGKAKKVFNTDDENLCIVDYKDDATAFNGKKKGTIVGKGIINNRVTNFLMKMLESKGVPTQLVEELSERETLVKKVKIVPLEVIIRNIAAGSFSKRFGVEEGVEFAEPTIEFCYKCDELDDPMVSPSHIYALGLASKEDVETITNLAFKINSILKEYFLGANIKLVDFKLEFGKTPSGEIILADEISPDTCRFWDADTNEKLDKDRFRRDLGGVEDAYAEIKSRLLGE